MTYSIMPPAANTNSGKKDAKGRTIWIGPRGGEFVRGAEGKKLPVAKGKGKVSTGVQRMTSPAINTERVNAKKRKVFKDSKGRTYVKQGDKKVYVKKTFTPERNPVAAPARSQVINIEKKVDAKKSKGFVDLFDTGKVNAQKRKVFKDLRGRTYVKQGDKKVYVKKLFTPKTTPASPAKSPAKSPARSPAKSPAKSPARSPAKSPARSPAKLSLIHI